MLTLHAPWPPALCPVLPRSIRPAQVRPEQGEKSVRIMAASSGGAIADQDVTNRWGRVANPPPELLYGGGGGSSGSSSAYGLQGGAPLTGLQARGMALGPRPGSAAGAAALPSTSSAPGPGGMGMGRPPSRGIYNAPPGAGAPKPTSSGFRPVYD